MQLVLIKAFPGFASAFAFTDELGQQWAGVEQGLLGVLLVPAVNDELGGVEPDVVGQLEGAHTLLVLSLLAGQVDKFADLHDKPTRMMAKGVIR